MPARCGPSPPCSSPRPSPKPAACGARGWWCAMMLERHKGDRMELFPHGLIARGGATVGYDVIGANLQHAPAGAQLAGYSTGSGPVPWSAAQFTAHPGTVRIDQDPAASDPTADVLDVERGAATTGDCPGWAKRAMADYGAATRPGQRWPAVYASASEVTPVVNALIAGGVTTGVGLWVANWDLTKAQAFADVLNAAGP